MSTSRDPSDARTLDQVLCGTGSDFVERSAKVLFDQTERFIKLDNGSLLVFRHDDLRKLGALQDVVGVPLDPWLQLAYLDRLPFVQDAHDLGAIQTFFANVITNLDTEAHSLFKPPFASAFSPKIMRDFEPVMTQLAWSRIEQLSDCESFDLLRDLYIPLGLEFWNVMLSFTPDEKAKLLHALPGASRAIGSRVVSPEDLADSSDSLADYFSVLTAALDRSQGALPFIDSIREKVEIGKGTPLGRPKTLELCIAASLSDGFHTMALGSANCAAALLNNERSYAEVRVDPTLLASAVNEGLRTLPPLGLFYRYTLADIDYEGWHLPAGTMLAMLWGAGSYDPAIHQSPERYDIHRVVKPLLTFGTGTQLCPGRNLVSMMSATVLKVLTSPNVGIELAGDLEWVDAGILPALNTTSSAPARVRIN